MNKVDEEYYLSDLKADVFELPICRKSYKVVLKRIEKFDDKNAYDFALSELGNFMTDKKFDQLFKDAEKRFGKEFTWSFIDKPEFENEVEKRQYYITNFRADVFDLDRNLKSCKIILERIKNIDDIDAYDYLIHYLGKFLTKQQRESIIRKGKKIFNKYQTKDWKW